MTKEHEVVSGVAKGPRGGALRGSSAFQVVSDSTCEPQMTYSVECNSTIHEVSLL